MIRLLGMAGADRRPPCQAPGLDTRKERIMPFTFRKRIKIIPGVYVNLGKKGASVTVKVGPVSHTRGTAGTRTSVDIPGPVGYTKRTSRKRRNES